MLKKKVIFFDLFYTLITPQYYLDRNENDVINLTTDEWETFAEDIELYLRRATGKVKDEVQIIEEIISKSGLSVTSNEKEEILKLRKNRMEVALTNIDKTVYEVLSQLKKRKFKLCIISNADSIDVASWEKSPLYALFDDAVFSYEVGYVKPQPQIYEIALKRMNVNLENSVFVGDGGSDEIKAAKQYGLTTIFSEYLLKRGQEQKNNLLKYSDYHINNFFEILSLPL